MNKLGLLAFLGLAGLVKAQVGKVGINAETPDATLKVKTLTTDTGSKNLDLRNATNQPLMLVKNDGNIAIGGETPAVKLDVNGYIKVGSADTLGDQNPQAGMIRFNATTGKFQGYIAGTTNAWVDLHN